MELWNYFPGEGRPSVFKVLDAFRKEAALAELDLIHQGRGDAPPRRNLRYVRLAADLARVVQAYGPENDIRRYLTATSFRA